MSANADTNARGNYGLKEEVRRADGKRGEDSPTITTASLERRGRAGVGTPHQEDGNEGEKHKAEYRAEEDHAAAYIAQRRTESGGWWSPRRRHGSGTKSRREAPVTPHRAHMLGQ